MSKFILVLILSIEGLPYDDVAVGNIRYSERTECEEKGESALKEFEDEIREGNTSATLNYICVDEAMANRFRLNQKINL